MSAPFDDYKQIRENRYAVLDNSTTKRPGVK